MKPRKKYCQTCGQTKAAHNSFLREPWQVCDKFEKYADPDVPREIFRQHASVKAYDDNLPVIVQWFYVFKFLLCWYLRGDKEPKDSWKYSCITLATTNCNRSTHPPITRSESGYPRAPLNENEPMLRSAPITVSESRIIKVWTGSERCEEATARASQDHVADCAVCSPDLSFLVMTSTRSPVLISVRRLGNPTALFTSALSGYDID